MALILYHNPRCSKSRQTLALLSERGVEPRIVEYMKTPPDAGILKALAKRMGVTAREMMRAGEKEYRDLGLNDESLDDDALFTAMADHPRLIQRPILDNGRQARIGRPPENVLEIL